MTNKQYQNIKLNYSGLVAVEFSEKTNYKVGDIYRFNENIFGIVVKSKYYEDYWDGRQIIVVELL